MKYINSDALRKMIDKLEESADECYVFRKLAKRSWEPTKKSLPEPLKIVAVRVFDRINNAAFLDADTIAGGKWYKYGGKSEYKVTHWMDIPLPPGKETE